MKKTSTGAYLLLSLSIFLFACKKDQTIPESNSPEIISVSKGGVVPDDPEKVAKVPLIVSSQSLAALTSTPEVIIVEQAKGPRGDRTAPAVDITSPSNGSAAAPGSSLTVNVSATDNTGVTSVNFSVDGVVKGTRTSAPYTFSWNTTGFANGTHTLKAVAQDAAGNSASSTIIVTLNTTVISPVNLPLSFQLLTPPVTNQGGEGACAVFATTYAARSIEYFYKTNATSYSQGTNVFSPEFVYNQTKVSDCGSGTGITTALDFMQTTGVPTWQSMPYSYTNGCSLMPTSTQTNEAANYKITSYSKLLSSDVTAIKTMLVNKHPVIITINPDDSFWNAQPGFIWRSYTGAPGISHSLIICGYDDAKHAYKVMNSWGTQWADSGYSWIDYDFYPQTSFYYCYVING